MSLRESLESLEKIADIATLAGMKGEVDEDKLHFVAGFNLGEGRSQMVYVRATGRAPNDAPFVTFFSPCLTVKTGLLKGISKEQALDLLVRNEQVPFARYGVWKQDGKDMIVASIDHLLDTLDPEELKHNMWAVALAADVYEKEHGQDKF